VPGREREKFYKTVVLNDKAKHLRLRNLSVFSENPPGKSEYCRFRRAGF